MKASGFAAGFGAMAAVGLVAWLSAAAQKPPAVDAEPPEGGDRIAAGPYRLSAPTVHENLTVFLVHGEDQIGGRAFLTLDEAIEQKRIVVHETGEVNELSVENVGADADIYIMGGDIVKGGRQDRVIATDFIVPPKSGKLPVASFCVEQGRWRQRGGEAAAYFSSSKACLNSKDLKLAARGAMKQGEVWKKVEETQDKLGRSVGGNVKAEASASSLQLTLENKQVQDTIAGYVKALSALPDGKKDVIGFAFAVNGKVNSVEICGSGALFRKMWPKLLNATAAEAAAEREKDKKFAPATAEAVAACIVDAEKGKETTRDLTKRVQEAKRETEKNVVFEARDRDNKNAVVRRSYIAK